MAHNIYNLFVIQHGLKPISKRVIHTFIADTYERAKIYFHDYIKDSENKIGYTLYKVAEIDKELKVKEMKVYITTGFEIKYKDTFQKRLIEEKELIEKASREKEIKEQLKILFKGKEIQC